MLLHLVPVHFSEISLLFADVQSYILWACFMRHLPIEMPINAGNIILQKFMSRCGNFTTDLINDENDLQSILSIVETYVIVFHMNNQRFVGLSEVDNCLQSLFLTDLLSCGDVIPSFAPYITRPLEFIILTCGSLYPSVIVII